MAFDSRMRWADKTRSRGSLVSVGSATSADWQGLKSHFHKKHYSGPSLGSPDIS